MLPKVHRVACYGSLGEALLLVAPLVTPTRLTLLLLLPQGWRHTLRARISTLAAALEAKRRMPCAP